MIINDLYNNILALNFLELNNLITQLENTLNIKADYNFKDQKNSLVEENVKETETSTSFEIILNSIKPDKKISVLKVVKSLLNLGLKESKEIVENLPHKLKVTNILKESEEIKQQIETAGGIIEIKNI